MYGYLTWNSTGANKLFTWYAVELIWASGVFHWSCGIEELIHRAVRGLGFAKICY